MGDFVREGLQIFVAAVCATFFWACAVAVGLSPFLLVVWLVW